MNGRPAELEETAAATLAASRALVGVIAASVAPALEQVTLPQLRVLVLLATHGPARTGRLAERLGVHQSTFTRNADRMVEAGLIRRVANPDSRREILIELTPAGRRLAHSVLRRRAQEIRRIVERLDDGERAAVLTGMQVFAQAAGEPTGPLLLLGFEP
jgi:DNA-binding MarR family transcriptional regulator